MSDTEQIDIGLNGMKAPLVSMAEAWGEGHFGWKLFLNVNNEPITKDDGWIVREALETAVEQIKVRHILEGLKDPKNPKALLKAVWLIEAGKVFAGAGLEVFRVDEIPNGYCSKSCCLHFPWLVMQTRLGPITIGWRKRVLEIDWSALKTAADMKAILGTTLFKDENVTVGSFNVHAWGYEKATEYLKKLAEAA